MACAYITDLATSIWKDIGEPTDITVSYVQTKLTSAYFLGKLNTILSTSYAIVDGDISPALGAEEQGIYALMYKSEYYGRRINSFLSGTAATMWVELSDGDGTVRRASPSELAKTIKDLKLQLDSELNKLAATYKMNNAGPRTVDYLTIEKKIPADSEYRAD